MSEKDVGESAPSASEGASQCESPPVAPAPARETTPDPRQRLLELAAELVRSNNRRLVVEFLRLRRAVG